MSTDADRTPTDLNALPDGTPTQTVVTDGTPTDQQLVSGSMAVTNGTLLEGRWSMERCLASGGYGDVWEGFDSVGQRRIAVKILRTDAGNNDPSAIARMRQEAEILSAMNHPNIVRVYGFGNSPYGHFMVMEMLDGLAIDQLLDSEGPIDPARAVPLVRQLLGALKVAHDKQVLHRDIKPENIIVVRDRNGVETAKLVDFGIAKATRLLNDGEEGATLVQTRSGGFMGTPRYAAPEQAVGDPCGPNIDLFALGLVIAEWLTGQRRIDGQRHADVMQQLLSPSAIDLSDVPYRWREWLGMMTIKNPRKRLIDAEAALNELEHLVVSLHAEGDFLDDDDLAISGSMQQMPMPQGQAQPQSSFADNNGPLELDFERARSAGPAPRQSAPLQPAPGHAPMQRSGPLQPADSGRKPITGTRAVLISTADAQRAIEQTRPASTGDKIGRIVLIIAVGVISFAAVAVLIFVLNGPSNP